MSLTTCCPLSQKYLPDENPLDFIRHPNRAHIHEICLSARRKALLALAQSLNVSPTSIQVGHHFDRENSRYIFSGTVNSESTYPMQPISQRDRSPVVNKSQRQRRKGMARGLTMSSSESSFSSSSSAFAGPASAAEAAATGAAATANASGFARYSLAWKRV